MRNMWVVFLSVCLLLTVGVAARAEDSVTWTSKVTVLVEDNQHNLLGSHSYAWGGTIPSSMLTTGALGVTFSLTPEPLWGKALFEKVPLLTNVGNTIWVASDRDDTYYSTILQRITDGKSDTMYGFFTAKSGSHQVGGGEISYTASSFMAQCHPDFGGQTVGRIGLRIDAASSADMGNIVPEPASLASLTCGIAGMCGFASRRRRRR